MTTATQRRNRFLRDGTYLSSVDDLHLLIPGDMIDVTFPKPGIFMLFRHTDKLITLFANEANPWVLECLECLDDEGNLTKLLIWANLLANNPADYAIKLVASGNPRKLQDGILDAEPTDNDPCPPCRSRVGQNHGQRS